MAEIFISADDDALVAGRGQDPHGGGDQIIGFDAATLEGLVAKQSGQALDLGKLLDDLIGRLIPLGLVFWQRGEVAVRATEVEEDRTAVRLLPVPEILEGLHPTMQGPRGELVDLATEVGPLHREVAPKDQIEAVDQQPAHGSSVARPGRTIEKKAGPPNGGPVINEAGGLAYLAGSVATGAGATGAATSIGSR